MMMQCTTQLPGHREITMLGVALLVAPGEGEDEAAVLGDVVRDDEQFEVLAATLRALVATAQPATAAALCQACVHLFGKCVDQLL